MLKLAIFLLFLAPIYMPAEQPPGPPLVTEAFQKMYNTDFTGAQSVISRYIGEKPRDPLGFAVRASAYLFSELDRMGILESEFFESDRRISDKGKRLKPDQATRDGFYSAVEAAQSLGSSYAR